MNLFIVVEVRKMYVLLELEKVKKTLMKSIFGRINLFLWESVFFISI